MDNPEGNEEAAANNPDAMEEDQETADTTTMEVDDERTKLNTLLSNHSRLGQLWGFLWTNATNGDPTEALLTALKNRAEYDKVFLDFFPRGYFGNDNDLDTTREEVYEQCVEAGLARATNNTNDRLASLTLGLDQEYKGSFDLTIFVEKVEETFHWYSGDHARFMGPSFAIIQSSGMGKTKLMKQYKTTMMGSADGDTDVKLLLCKHGNQTPPQDHQDHFDALLEVPNMPPNNQDEIEKLSGAAVNMIHFLESLVKDCTKTKIVLLFDEAHVLVKESRGGFYVALRWWLRQRRAQRIAAVFAGTLLSLANYSYQLGKPSLGWTRDATKRYVNYDDNDSDSDLAKVSYDPFYTFTTMAMEHVRVAEGQRGDDYSDALGDIRRCGKFGRPLFLAMLKPGIRTTGTPPELTLQAEDVTSDGGRDSIVNGRLYNILARVLLSESENWRDKQQSVASVLATRVQLGIASYDFVTEATSKGYANLVHFRGGEITSDDRRPGTDIKRFGAASITFPPDPVCAALAMGLMQDSWTLYEAADALDFIKGEDPRFWVAQARMVFEQQLFLPNRGDAGGVFAALYMLLCGDVLRKASDPFMREFEIDLLPWVLSLAEEDEASKQDEASRKRKKAESAGNATGATRRSPRVAKQTQEATKPNSAGQSSPVVGEVKLNFIQVVRNYFRTHAWFSQEYLKYMYDTAVACYVYANCPAFDLVFPVKCGDVYRPALVSIKCWDAIGASDMKQAVQDMKEYLQGYREDEYEGVKALCILIVIGSQVVGKAPASEGVFPKEDAFVTVVVPKHDRFGATEAIVATATASVRAEVLASHSFAHVEDRRYNALRASTKARDRQFGYALIRDQLTE